MKSNKNEKSGNVIGTQILTIDEEKNMSFETHVHKKELPLEINTHEDEMSKITKINNNYKCEYCQNIFDSISLIEIHIKQYCKYDIRYNNFYIFDTEKMGINVFKDDKNAGDIYIVQTEFSVNDYFKIGITNDIEKRLNTYRTGCIYEPKLHYYFPCKDIKFADNVLKRALKKYNVKREIFKGHVEILKEIIMKNLKIINDDVAYSYKPTIKIGDVNECIICDKVFLTMCDLQDHNKLNHQDTIICKHCDKPIPSNTSLKKHIEICLPKLKFKHRVSLLTKELAKKDIIIGQLQNGIQINAANAINVMNIANSIDIIIPEIPPKPIEYKKKANASLPAYIKMIYDDPEEFNNKTYESRILYKKCITYAKENKMSQNITDATFYKQFKKVFGCFYIKRNKIYVYKFYDLDHKKVLELIDSNYNTK